MGVSFHSTCRTLNTIRGDACRASKCSPDPCIALQEKTKGKRNEKRFDVSPVQGEVTAAQGGTSAAGLGHLPSGGPGSDTWRMSLRGNEHPRSKTRTPARVKQGADGKPGAVVTQVRCVPQVKTPTLEIQRALPSPLH